MEDYYEYLDSNGVTTLYKLIKDDTVALIDSYSVTINGITTNLDNHVNNADIHTPIFTIEGMIDTKVAGLVNSAPETLDTLKELSDALGNDPNFATTVANQIGSKADKDDVYTKLETDTLLEGKANSVHSHVVSDITDFPTIPTKVSDLTNDSGYITGVAWGDITSKPSFSDIAISGSYNDLVDTPIIPTKTSQLINDSGFLTSSNGLITSVSWSDITDKPNFSTVATSGSYTDLSNTPTIPTKVSQLENDMGFGTGDTSDCVHKTGDETINGTKTFTVGPVASNSATTNGYFIKLNAVARNEVPTQLYHATFRALDKNSTILGEYCVEKSTGGESLLNMNVRSEDASGTQIAHGLQFRMTNDGSVVRFIPTANNKVHLGDVNAKWLKVHSDDVVHTSGDETIAGNKTFTNNVYCYSLKHPTDDSYFFVSGGSEWDKGANLFLYGISLTGGYAGVFELVARNATQTKTLTGYPDGALTWGGKSLALDENLVHKTGDEYINGTKIFSNIIHRYADLTTSGGAQVYRFDDTNANGCGHIYNNVHWHNNAVYNRHGAYNAKSGKSMEIDITSNDSGVGMAYVAGTASKGNLETVTSETGHTGIATMGWVNNPATSTNVVHRSGNEYIGGIKSFSSVIYLLDNIINKNNQVDLATTPTSNLYTHYLFIDKNGKTTAYMQHCKQTTGTDYVGLFVKDKSENLIGVELTTNKEFIPFHNNTYSLGSPNNKWANVYATTFNGNSVMCTGGNAFMAQNGGYTFLIRNDGSNTYLLMSDKDGTPGTWSTARPLIIDNATGVCNINGYANTASYATTQATSDNSTKIATTAWVRTYVNSVVGSNTVGSSVSAYWSNSSNVAATGKASSGSGSGGYYLECYSGYVTKTPVVGTIYSGAQLYTVLNTYASAIGYTTGSSSGYIYTTESTAQATFSNPISATGKYLCTTANTVKFRAYTAKGSSSAVGSSSVVDNSSTKSIFIRVE